MKYLAIPAALLLALLLAAPSHAEDSDKGKHAGQTPQNNGQAQHGGGPSSMSELVNTVDYCDTED